MSVRINSRSGFSALFIFGSLASFATTGFANDTTDFEDEAQITSTPISSSKEVHLRLGTGLGVFQDLQVPVDTDIGLRIDGTTPSPDENTTHTGFPIYAGLNFLWPRGALTHGVGFEALQVEATTGNPMTRTSSYARIELKPTSTWSFSVLNQDSFLSASVALRRSLYKNVSDGHYADTAMTRFTAGFEAPGEARVEAFGGYAPISRFSYDTGKGFQNTTMKDTTSSAYEFGASLNYRVHKSTWFDFTAEQEVVSVNVENTRSYEAFGLVVGRSQEESRRYNLQTTLMRVGMRRVF